MSIHRHACIEPVGVQGHVGQLLTTSTSTLASGGVDVAGSIAVKKGRMIRNQRIMRFCELNLLALCGEKPRKQIDNWSLREK